MMDRTGQTNPIEGYRQAGLLGLAKSEQIPLHQRSMLRGILIGAVAGVFLAFSGAFGSLQEPLWIRLIYWVPLIVLGGLWSQVCSPLLERLIDTSDRPWLEVILLSLIMSVPVTLTVWIATTLLFWRELPMLQHLPHFFVPVLLITLILAAINVLASRKNPIATHYVEGHPPARFLQRLPLKLKGATLWAIQSEDHYLRLHTSRGSDLILMRLSDALEELDGLEGAQTHRSWWVAKDAVREVARGDGRATLTLVDGTLAPVSRRHARALREAGWW
ncbi:MULTISPECIES: LytTR family DNA-binding domain-containing protein [unclassified Brevundimonas]|uniref:LytTR family DNA-binding domain-containing protein n=1 Tax=unclassified Brevundimonas TaxID=2622653 RepID=UPI0025B9D31A|nr:MULTISPECIES: LytTR family transcriptional regulator DNA-binding domain-containing protein [unclassified Brevundimonas]